jgi:hypothetical protein
MELHYKTDKSKDNQSSPLLSKEVILGEPDSPKYLISISIDGFSLGVWGEF